MRDTLRSPEPGFEAWAATNPTGNAAAGPGAPGALLAGGTDGNERLTAQTGAVLFLLLAALGVTIVRIGQLTWLHLFLGLLVIGPVALKIASTGYRFTRYYGGDREYRRKGPPPAPLRALGPVVVLSTVGVLATGVVLLALGPSSRDTWMLPHKAFFIVWVAATSLHVLGHALDMRHGLLGARRTRAEVMAAAGTASRPSRVTVAGWSLAARLPGSTGRALALSASLAAGLALALVLVPHFGPWVHDHRFHHDH